jgi:predicted DNA-binding transcriptional regulator AlpA
MTRTPTFITIKILKTRLNISTATAYRMFERDPDFPKPIRIGRKVLFVESEVDNYIQARLAARILTRDA